jgi:hypothetical protein
MNTGTDNKSIINTVNCMDYSPFICEVFLFFNNNNNNSSLLGLMTYISTHETKKNEDK